MNKHEQILQRRYWLIRYDTDYPEGGLKSVEDSFDDIHEAEKHYSACKREDEKDHHQDYITQLFDSSRKVYLHKD